MKKILYIIVVISLFYNHISFATTWDDNEIICPVCKEKNIFKVYYSYGSYIYKDKSRYQYVFWPVTNKNFVYCCKNCLYSAFIGDFKNISKENAENIQKELKNIKLKKKYDHYYDIPVSERMKLAEKAYKLEKKDDRFWCDFYRIYAFHLNREKRLEEAKKMYQKTIKYAEKCLLQDKYKNIKKELYLIIGAMNYALKNNEKAFENMCKAKKNSMNIEGKSKYENNMINKNFNSLIDDITKHFDNGKIASASWNSTGYLKKLYNSIKNYFYPTINIFEEISNNNIEKVKEYIKLKRDVNAKDNRGGTLLMYSTGNTEIFKLLVENGADINLKTDINQTVLMSAVTSGNIEIVKYLIDSGVDVNEQDKTLRFSALMLSRDIEITRLLLENGALVDLKGMLGLTILDYANEPSAEISEEMKDMLKKYRKIQKK